MFKKLKDILGIEGIKMTILIDDPISLSEGMIHGDILLTTLRDQEVENIELTLVEKYQRGRKESKLIDEYDLGSIILSESFLVTQGVQKKIYFVLPFVENLSEMDHFEQASFINKGLVALAKKIKGVKSTYKLTATAKVKGTTFNPIATREIIFES